ncbi:hypothetical protein [Paraburkholderia sp. C35]|uniref:hypothetical protein n=1 Tax=Paraburkholderia sp. C35 TaxID=2126993 RepID=UPI000D69053F|nr:hypothetical protein [Paraburkholderia sp. C35]
MGRRSDIDWEAIERDYRVGQLSLRQIAQKHEVALSAIVRRAKKYEWTRDLSQQVRAQTKAGLIQAAVEESKQKAQEHVQEKLTESVQSDAHGILAAAAANVQIITEHRKDIRAEAARSKKLAEKLDTLMENATDAKDVALLVSSHESLVRSRTRLIGLEREAYGIGEAEPPPDDNDAIDLGRASDLRALIRGRTAD